MTSNFKVPERHGNSNDYGVKNYWQYEWLQIRIEQIYLCGILHMEKIQIQIFVKSCRFLRFTELSRRFLELLFGWLHFH